MGAVEAMTSVIVVHAGVAADAALLQTFHAAGIAVRTVRSIQDALAQITQRVPDAVVVEAAVTQNNPAELAELSTLPDRIRLIVLGDPSSVIWPATVSPPDCVVISDLDEAALRSALTRGPPVSADVLVRDLISVSVFGLDLPITLEHLATRLAYAFHADNCVVLLPDEARCYMARPVSVAAVDELARTCESVARCGTTVITPVRRDNPYRTFLGLPLSRNSGPPLALLMLCRERPLPFGRDALLHLRGLALRLSADLSWRLVHDRLVADREKLRELSRIDPVLGVANRTALQEELSRRVTASERRGEPFSVAIVDVDGLRLINERNGYPAGDAVLVHVAQIALREVRAQDLVARYAGDSLAIVMPGADAAEATTIITNILSAIDTTQVVHEATNINLTVSAGIAELRYDDDTGEAALARAMTARERARLHGEVIAMADASVGDAPVPLAFEIGTTLGGVYQIRHEISRGAFGVVYRAEDLALGRQVALKLLRPDLVRDTSLVDRFRTEAATLARIRNPHLVQVYAFGVDGPNVFFAMELIEGQGLDQRIQSARKRQRHLPIPDVIGIINEVAEALEAVHRGGMLHRDVKPDNVLIDRIQRRCVLVDVGIAVRRGEKNPAGTPGFTAPEVFGAGGEGTATDVYGLAALAYLLLTLHKPFDHVTPFEVLRLQSSGRPRPLTQLRVDLPLAVDAVLLPALDPDPSRRPQSAGELAKALAEALSRLGIAPRQTFVRAAVDAPETRRPLISQQMSPRADLPSAPSTRGVLFHSAYEVLGARRGSAWVADVSRKLPDLALPLAPQTSLLAWHPTDAFISVLASLGNNDRECHTMAMQLGRTAVELSFNQFYGADPTALSPAEVLRAADHFWRCYHSWGALAVTARDADADVTVSGSIGNSMLCASTAGLLAGVVACSGGFSVRVEHDVCLARGANRCTFRLRWELGEDVKAGHESTLSGIGDVVRD